MNKEVLINKYNKLDEKYIPNNLCEYINKKGNIIYIEKETLEKFKKLKNYLKCNNIVIDAEEGYRSYNNQEKVLKECIVKKGIVHALKYVALPGTSEHQTGFAIDISVYINDIKIYEHDMYDLKELEYIHKIIHKFGFILRYDKGKESITGYNYEPWHLRYVGNRLSKIIYTNDITLEEYYNK